MLLREPALLSNVALYVARKGDGMLGSGSLCQACCDEALTGGLEG